MTSRERRAPDEDDRITKVVERERSGLLRYIRRRVADPADVEDILQEVFYELVEANRLLVPIDHVTAWLFRVARNRIVDLFRKKKPERGRVGFADDDEVPWEELLPSPDDGPEALHARHVVLEEIEAALAELPRAQREVFVAHEIEGKSFRQMAAESGVSINTLLARKRYAVLHLRERLQDAYDELSNEEGETS